MKEKRRKYTIGSEFEDLKTYEKLIVINHDSLDDHYYTIRAVSDETTYDQPCCEEYLEERCRLIKFERFKIGDRLVTIREINGVIEKEKKATVCNVEQINSAIHLYDINIDGNNDPKPTKIWLFYEKYFALLINEKNGGGPATCSGIHEEKQQDNINQPPHYTQGGIETIDFIEAKLTREEVIGAYKFNIIKYSVRANLKNGEEDLKKMNYYSDRLIKFLEKKINDFKKLGDL